MSIRFPESDEIRYRRMAEEIGLSLVDWIRETMFTRAKQIESWLESGEFKELKSGRKIFPDEYADKPKGK